MPVLLHVAPDPGSIENVERCKQRGGAVAFVIMGHRSEPPVLERQPRLRAVECLYLALFVEGQHNRVRGWIDIQPDNIMEFVRELRVVRQLELPVTVRLQAVRLPDAAHRAGADPAGRSHHVRRPVRRLAVVCVKFCKLAVMVLVMRLDVVRFFCARAGRPY